MQTAYQKLMAGARIPFDGRELTFPQLTPYKESPEREMRKAAFFAEGGFLEQHAQELDGIYDELVKVRTRIAKSLGMTISCRWAMPAERATATDQRRLPPSAVRW